jgi:hypothetical protein
MICCVSRTGEKIPPLIVLSSASKKPTRIIEVNGIFHCYTRNAWTNGRIMTLWMEHVFSRRKTVGKKCILIMDNASFHKDQKFAAALTNQNGMTDFLPPNTTCRLQPLDHSINGLLKNYIREEWTIWMRRDNPTLTRAGRLQIAQMNELLGWCKRAWDRISEQNVQRSFDHCFLMNPRLPQVLKPKLRRRRKSI